MATPTAAIYAKIPAVKERLAKSVNGYVCVRRIGMAERAALSILIEREEAEIFDGPLGRAYRLTEKGKK